MDYKNMTNEELMERRSAIGIEAEAEGADTSALLEEVRAINAEIETRKKAAAAAAELRSAIATETVEVTVVEVREETQNMDVEIRNTPEYINAFAEYLKTGEKRNTVTPLLTENGSGDVPVPDMVDEMVKTAWENEKIMALVKKTYVKGNLKVAFELSADGAVIHTEGGDAIDSEELELGVVDLTPVSIKKWIAVSDEALDLTGEAFLRYLIDEITYQIAKKAVDTLIAKIAALTTASASAPGAATISAAPGLGVIAEALGQISDQASNPVVVMNKVTWAAFKAAQYEGNFAADIFEGLPVLFNNSLPAFSAADEEDVYAIVGDFGYGAQANFPNGQEITIKVDDLSLAEADLVKIIGRQFVAIAPVADQAFCLIAVPEAEEDDAAEGNGGAVA